jgi:hypothetical protein
MGKDELGAALLVVCALLACKSGEQRERTQSVATTTKAAPTVEPTPGHASGAPRVAKRETVAPLAEALDKLRRSPDSLAEGVDKTGKKTITWRFKALPNTSLVELAQYRSNPDAWRFEVSGVPCADIGQLGLEVTQLSESRALPPHFNARYEVKGGPLDGTIARVFNQGVESPRLCTVLPGTVAYWDLAATE